MKIAVSFLKGIDPIQERIKKINQTSCEYLHVDLTDGLFVPNKNISFEELKSLLKENKKPLDVHLMTLDLENWVKNISSLNPEYITFHIEATSDPLKIIDLIKFYGVKVGITLKPETPLELIEPYLNLVDLVLIMAVKPGEGGQKFLSSALERLETLTKLKKENNFLINIDGGINDTIIPKLQNNLPDIIVSGSFICNEKDYEEQIKKLR